MLQLKGDAAVGWSCDARENCGFAMQFLAIWLVQVKHTEYACTSPVQAAQPKRTLLYGSLLAKGSQSSLTSNSLTQWLKAVAVTLLKY